MLTGIRQMLVFLTVILKQGATGYGSIHIGNAFFGEHWRNSATKKVSTWMPLQTREEAGLGWHLQGRPIADRRNNQTHSAQGCSPPLQQGI